MNDKSLDVLRQYDLEVNQVGRGRGGMLLDTKAGVKLFLECEKPDKYYERENLITQSLVETGFSNVDTILKNREGKLVTEAEDGRRYVVKDWFMGRECNTKSIDEICRAVEMLGELHNSLNKLDFRSKQEDAGLVCVAEVKDEDHSGGVKRQEVTAMKNVSERHMKELKLASNYLRNKRNKSEFEQIAYKNIGSFYQEAALAVKRMDKQEMTKRFCQAVESGEMCHGNYNYHNIIFADGDLAVTNFDKCKNECQISDLYQFMRKILEKYEWDMELAYKMLDEYDKIKPLSDMDLELLSVMFAFPEKFWKVINFYFNSSKSWIPRKSVEKLKTVVAQNEKRRRFLETIS
ncbi:MAG: CotS family spore coat protein [Eubacteriales bacterium]|nr:CotS family spore coat protein [Eubacteriales bacterium]